MNVCERAQRNSGLSLYATFKIFRIGGVPRINVDVATLLL
jgi:hypothetical protein